MIHPTRLSCSSAAFGELSRGILRLGKPIRFQARGTSMHPLVRDGDILQVKPLGVRPLKLGDVVLCETENHKALVHRVVRIKRMPDEAFFLVKGDHLNHPDGWFGQDAIYGIVTIIERGGRKMSLGNPIMKFMGWVTILHSRLNPGMNQLLSFSAKIAERLPITSFFLNKRFH